MNVFGLKKKEFSSLRLPFGHYRTFTDKQFKNLFAKMGFVCFQLGKKGFGLLSLGVFPQCDVFQWIAQERKRKKNDGYGVIFGYKQDPMSSDEFWMGLIFHLRSRGQKINR